jgi:hypothetical protein
VRFFSRISILIICGLSLFIHSCSSYKSRNFLKQKYLSGHLKTVYPDNQVDNEAVLEETDGDELYDSYQTAVPAVENVDAPEALEEDNGIHQPPIKTDVERSEEFNSVEKGRPESFVKRTFKKNQLKRGGGNLGWTVPLAVIMFVLGAFSLILFIVIGWWAFAVAAGFFILGIIFMSLARPPTARGWGGKVATAIGMAAVMAGIIVLAIVVLIIWLIVWLVLLIFK